ncbi:hypothetical protein AGABI2DRAFT_222826 [Agaricus bisporus var. bisporus H97]|uniref:hypothetical protein n=1 Tax=Agaricus bisporus var. bisporus (strain H97 / ATCC MYA-4626 / FGSC 10389) TaxID=936046 RepID=UPI00029F62B2|nr:hypothetical protein AGABI2DRAFT_222826 [Agaricus bisporus var. bisporus H97]EKV46526.1 hypothetical protein AGABI2DRAFT_222826 [Agaricus bisporus var. bisporus H97]
MSIQSKHFLNTSESLVVDSLKGLCALNPQLALDVENKTVFVAKQDRSKVALMCGGGSGHEPAHAGFVGEGMLTSAVCGNVFASPSAGQVRRGIDLIDNEKGYVMYPNYTGDVLNFGLAKEQYAAMHSEKANRVKFVIVGDDVAVGRTQGKIVGRRGLAGTVLVYKIAGALAHRGGSLDEVYKIAEWTSQNIATVGTSLGHVHVPGTAPLETNLGQSEIEIGMGIHNESGHQTVSPIPPLSQLILRLIDMTISTSDPDRSFIPFKGQDEVVLLVNNLGGLSELELGAIVGQTRDALDVRGLKALRVLSGSFMSSLNMPGFSITLLLLPREGDASAPSAQHILSLLDDKPDVPGWKWSSAQPPAAKASQIIQSTATAQQSKPRILKAVDPDAFVKKIRQAANALIKAEPDITRMDLIAGDGDCGLTLKAGAEAILKKIDENAINGNDVAGSVMTISQVSEEIMGGTSGALYSIFFSGLSQGLQTTSSDVVDARVWAQALKTALDNLYTYTRARPPSRTLVDPLEAFITAISASGGERLADAVRAADKAAEATKDLEAKAGRSAYVEGDKLKQEQVPDPGAWGVKVILENILA